MHTAAEVTFESNGAICRGTLLLPQISASVPIVILCTGFGGTQDTPAIRAASRAFVDAGYASLTFDYRGFGSSDGEPRQMVDIADQLSDIRAAMDAVRSNPRLDASRIILWGTSLGGGHVVTAAADREDVVAVVAQVPFNGFPRKVEGRSTMTAVRLFVAMVRDRLRGAFRRPPAYIPLVGPAESLAVMASDSAWLAIAGLDSPTWRNEVAPRGLFASYNVSHFEVYRPDVRARILTDQVAFLREVV